MLVARLEIVEQVCNTLQNIFPIFNVVSLIMSRVAVNIIRGGIYSCFM